jgi:hypothetical protein
MHYNAMNMRSSPTRLRRRYIILVLLILDLLLVGAVRFRLSDQPPSGNAWGAANSARDALRKTQNRAFLPVAPEAPRAGRLIVRATSTSGPGIPPLPVSGDASLQARVEIVWPHEAVPLRDADLANITVFLVNGSGNQPVACADEPVVRLWRALNAAPARLVGIGQKRMFKSGGHTFPVWDFNDVDVSAARNPGNRLAFFATVDGQATRQNVWVHGADARTVFPQADVPASMTTQLPALLDARIEILWPHNDQPPGRAHLANITAYLFDAQTGRALAPELAASAELRVRLHQALNNDSETGPASGYLGALRTVKGANGQPFAAWDFNDVDIEATRDTLNKQQFWITVDDMPTFTNIWTHGAAAPTIYPQALALTSCK